MLISWCGLVCVTDDLSTLRATWSINFLSPFSIHSFEDGRLMQFCDLSLSCHTECGFSSLTNSLPWSVISFNTSEFTLSKNNSATSAADRRSNRKLRNNQSLPQYNNDLCVYGKGPSKSILMQNEVFSGIGTVSNSRSLHCRLITCLAICHFWVYNPLQDLWCLWIFILFYQQFYLFPDMPFQVHHGRFALLCLLQFFLL